MRAYSHCLISLIVLMATVACRALAQNPIITNQFTADPSARVFEDRVYVYPSHDIPPGEGRGRPGWFCMEDYHVFSSENLVDWTDHGVIVSQQGVPWVNAKSYSMWAPDCINRHGKYYFYFPAPAKDTAYGRGFCVGVAVSDKPSGPFAPQPEPIKGVHGIDPALFIDENGEAYLYWAMRGQISVAALKENMVELASEPRAIEGLPEKGLKEGPSLFERHGVYYLAYPHAEDKTERLEYAISDNPMGPFKVAGVIMDESPECWTNHQSIMKFKEQWYLFYHHNDLSPNFDKNRSVRIDSLFFNEDGTIRKVIPTRRGVGAIDASQTIQIDRYSFRSEKGASTDFLDTLNRFEGWKAILETAHAWIQFNSVDFGHDKSKWVSVRVSSRTGGTVQMRLDSVNGPIAAEVIIPGSQEWSIVRSPLFRSLNGIHNLVVLLKENGQVGIDWATFE